jgi:hypothetical protein
MLADESLILRDKNFRQIRQNMILDDYVFPADHSPDELKVLLERNPKNRMAFEYLMAFYLLECNVGEIVANIGRLADFNYTRIPRHYEEALVFYVMITGKHDFDLGSLKVSVNTLQRFQDYHTILARYNGDRDAARPELLRKYGNTFWFYAMYVNPPDDLREKETINFGDNR